MNFEFFQDLYSNTQFDEIKVIGKDVCKEGHFYHIIGMTLREKLASLYVLEFANTCLEESDFRRKTPRESLKDNMESQRNAGFFMQIREFQSKDWKFEVAGASSSPLKYSDYSEAYMLFFKMQQAGWRISEKSPFYDADWDSFAITNIEIREDVESLPEWSDDIQVLFDSIPENYAIELPVLLECGKTKELEFLLKDGEAAICYINKIYTMDVWAENEEKFADCTYKERMLQHMTEAEFEHMKEQFFEVLAEHCPRDKHYMVIEYECSKDLGLTFHDSKYLDTVEEPQEGSATALLMNVKPEQELGEHGLKLRGCVIQKPLDRGIEVIEAELFSYSQLVEKKNTTI